MTAKLAMIYERMFQYLELQLSIEHNTLCVINPQNSKTMVKQVLVCKTAFNGFTL